MTRTATLDIAYRPLTDFEIMALEAAGCTAEDWDRVEVAENFDPRSLGQVAFSGDVRLGSYRGEVQLAGGLTRPPGIYNATLHNCHVGNNVLIRNVGRHIANYAIGDDVVIDNIDLLATEGETSFGAGARVSVLNEAGGRAIPIFDRLSSQLAYMLALYRHRGEAIAAIEAMIDRHVAARKSTRGAIRRGAHLVNCGPITNLWVGEHARICGAARLTDGTVNSSVEAPARIGAGVVAEHFILSSGSVLDGAALISRCFVGQGVRLDRQFSAEHCAIFSNCEFHHGEANSILAGPHTVSHHKSTLLIAGLFSFFNAGAGTNQSNHLYKLGPLHQGVVERGVKTGSGGYLLWPSRVGAFTIVVGRHPRKIDTSAFPFSYLLEKEGQSVLWPGANLHTAGTRRDAAKWRERDRRTDPDQLDHLHYDVLNPDTVGRMIQARNLLREWEAATTDDPAAIHHQGARIPRARLRRSAGAYDLGIQVYLGGKIAARAASLLENTPTESLLSALLEYGTEGEGPWTDLLGLLAPKAAVDRLLDDLASGTIDGLIQLETAMERMYAGFAAWEWNWVRAAWLGELGKSAEEVTLADLADAVSGWKAATGQRNKWVLRDAEQEFAQAAQVGYGVDHPEHAAADFQAVRGAFEDNPFTRQVQEEDAQIATKADTLLAQLTTPEVA